jgi:hypothetical protein
VFRAAVLLLPIVALAQTPPAKVDRALRARASEFFEDHVNGTFRKAIDLVAEDTKDYYFAVQKVRYKSFKIDSVNYSDKFTRATVQATCERMIRMSAEFPETLVTVPVITTWKIEDGKWVWYHDQTAPWMPPQTRPVAPPKPDPNTAAVKAPDLSPGAIATATREILNQQSSVDKTEVTLAADKTSSDQVIFHNGFQGSVQIALDKGREIPGFTAELDKVTVNAGENAILKVRYEPTGKDPGPSPVLRLTVQPFNQVLTISVKFAPK